VIGAVRVQVGQADRLGGALDVGGLGNQRGDGVAHQFLAFEVLGGDQLVEVLAFLGAVDQCL